MPAPRLGSSRQCVVFRPCPVPGLLSFVFAECSDSCSFWGAKCVVLRVRSAEFAAFKTVNPFVFKYFLASFPLFSIFPSVLLSVIPGHFRFHLSVGASWRQATTICLEHDHNYRLSCGLGFVKQKIAQSLRT